MSSLEMPSKIQTWVFGHNYTPSSINASQEEAKKRYKLSDPYMVAVAPDGRPLKVYFYHPIQNFMKKDMGEDDLMKLKSFLENEEEGLVTRSNAIPKEERHGYPGTQVIITVDKVCAQTLRTLAMLTSTGLLPNGSLGQASTESAK